MDEAREGGWDGLARTTPLELALGLTALSLLLNPIGDWRFRPIITSLAAVALLWPAARRHAWLWFGLALAAGLRVLEDWPLPDNHAYLLVYWCLAAGLALRSNDPVGFLAGNARVLVGLVFVFAMVWKVFLSPDFLSGDFMRFTWIMDARFETAARLFGMDSEILEHNRSFLAGVHGAPQELVLTDAFRRVTAVASLGTLAIEGLVAVCFLFRMEWAARLRDGALLLFCVTTYAVATVAGFAWLLLAMGVAQCPSEQRRTRLAYLGTFGLVYFYREVPWLNGLAEWVGG